MGSFWYLRRRITKMFSLGKVPVKWSSVAFQANKNAPLVNWITQISKAILKLVNVLVSSTYKLKTGNLKTKFIGFLDFIIIIIIIEESQLIRGNEVV